VKNDIRQYVRYRNHAEAFLVLAELERIDPVNQQLLLQAAVDYEMRASSARAIIQSRLARKG
jgi:hypothetical protein